MLAAIPIGYALAENGYQVNVEPMTSGKPTTMATIEDFPALPLFEAMAPYDATCDLSTSWQWNSPVSLLDMNLDRFHIRDCTTPRTAMLQTPERYENLPAEYVVLCGSGVSFAEVKRLTIAQMAAVREAGRRIGFRTVLVGAEKGETAPVDIDLRGKTTISELCKIIAHARAVVSVDTGVMHLAGAYNVPMIALMPYATIGGHLSEYSPKIVLCGATASHISPQDIEAATVRLVRVAREQFCIVGPDRECCGVAETGRVMAKACGVEYRTYREHDGGPCIAEYHNYDGVDLHKNCKPENTVLSLHRHEGLVLDQWAGVMFRGRAAMRQVRHLAKRWRYVPLHTPYVISEPRKYRADFTIAWHGQLRDEKGLAEIITATKTAHERNPQIKLKILGSLPTGLYDENLYQTVMDHAGDAVEVDIRDNWEREDLYRAMETADCHIAFDKFDKEQSGVAATDLGFGVPVIVSCSTAFDDVRGWCVTSTREGLAETILHLASDEQAYNNYAKRAWLGAQYRKPELIARQYRAAIIQSQL